MKRRSRLLLVLAISNLLLAVIVPIAASAAVGLSYTVITSTYRELDTRGVIDHASLATVWGKSVADDWGQSVRRLIGEPLAGLYRASYWVAATFGLQSIVLIAAWYLNATRDR